MEIKQVEGSYPEEFEYLRNGTFINLYPTKNNKIDKDNEGANNNLYTYYQTFVNTTDEIILNRVKKEMFKTLFGTISQVQCRLVLLEAGLLDELERIIHNSKESEIIWKYASYIERDNVLITTMGEALNLSEEQIDDLFIRASKIH